MTDLVSRLRALGRYGDRSLNEAANLIEHIDTVCTAATTSDSHDVQALALYIRSLIHPHGEEET